MKFINFTVDEQSGDYTLSKPALVFVEGQHTDSQKRTHFFNKDRIHRIVANSNEFFRQGRRIPFQLDHKKDQSSNIGDVESEFYTKVIQLEDLPNPRHKHLVGKLGVFVDNIIARGADIVEKIKSKSISTLSPGIDPATESFCEISATPVPAIIGPSLFSKNGDVSDNIIYFETSFTEGAKIEKDSTLLNKNKAFSFDHLEKLTRDISETRKEYDKICDGLFKILSDISMASEEELGGINPQEASFDAIEHFIGKISEMFDLEEDEEDEEDMSEETLGRSSGQPYPIGKGPSDFSRNTVKSIGYIIK